MQQQQQQQQQQQLLGHQRPSVIRGISPSPSHEDAAKLNGEADKKGGKKLDEETKQVSRKLPLESFTWVQSDQGSIL